MRGDVLTDYYALLGIPRNSTVSEIHKAYWHKASRCHPDKGGNHEEMVQLVEAWKILSNPQRRARYDQLLTCRHDGWRNTKFNDDVKNARMRAKDDAARSWAEFEEIYQKAFYTFNQDFYGAELGGKIAGAYSPLMGTRKAESLRHTDAKDPTTPAAVPPSRFKAVDYAMKVAFLIVTFMAVIAFYRSSGGLVRYVPMGQQSSDSILMLDTATGAVYSVDKQSNNPSAPWKVIIPPVSKEKKSSGG